MKNTFKVFGIIILSMIIGFSFLACGEPAGGSAAGSGQYTGKDVLGNTYSLSVGSDSSKAAVKGDNFKMDVKTRDGKTRNITGTVTDVSADGTLTLKQSGTNVEFTAMVDGTGLDAVIGDATSPLTLGSGGDAVQFVPRSFDNIFLRVQRWESNTDVSVGKIIGENYGSGLTVLVKDFPTNVSKLVKENDRYTITITGTSNVDLDNVALEVQGVKENGDWVWLAQNEESVSISANTPFNKTVTLDNITSESVSLNFMDYKEIVLQFTNVIKKEFEDHPDWDSNVIGSIPADIPDGTVMATISNFNIVLKDKTKEALAGNMSDYTYGFKEDGLSVEYKQAVWKLSAENIVNAKKSGARFEFAVGIDNFEEKGTRLDFVWQDPVSGLWWQDQSWVSGMDPDDDYQTFKLGDGVTWDASRKRISIDLSAIVSNELFSSSTELNLIIGCWWFGEEEAVNIDVLDIMGANIVVPPQVTNTGNMGNYVYGYKEDGITIEEKQAVWNISDNILTFAQTDGAKLELVFKQDLESRENYPMLILYWQDITDGKWWPNETDDENLIIFMYDTEESTGKEIDGVTYDSTAKKLSVEISKFFGNYYTDKAFADATDVNIVFTCWWGIENNISELGIVSANIIAE